MRKKERKEMYIQEISKIMKERGIRSFKFQIGSDYPIITKKKLKETCTYWLEKFHQQLMEEN